MAIIYSNAFPGGPALGCAGSGCACCDQAAVVSQAVSPTTVGTFRFRQAIFATDPFEIITLDALDNTQFPNLCPGPVAFQMVLYAETGGAFRVRITKGTCTGATPDTDDYTTAPGVFPVDGTYHGVQFTLSLVGTTVTWSLTVDNLLVDSRVITGTAYPLVGWTTFGYFIGQSPALPDPATVLSALDDVQVEDSVLVTDYPACASVPLSRLSCFFIPPVTNQVCTSAQHLDPVPVELFADCRGSTADGSSVVPSCAASPGDPSTRNNPLWFRFTPDHDGHYALAATRLNDSQPLPCLSVWCPSCESLTEYLCRDYSVPLPGPPVPENVTCASALDVSLFPYSAQFDLTAEGDPPETSPSCGGSSRPVWFRVTVPLSATHMVITTDGSTYDTTLALYTGPCEALVEVDCSDDDFSLDNPRNSTIARTVSPGEVYYVLALAYNSGPGSGGTLVLSIDETTPVPVVTPDDVRGFFQADRDYLILVTFPTDLSETYGVQAVHLTIQEVGTSVNFPPEACQEIGPPGVTLPC